MRHLDILANARLGQRCKLTKYNYQALSILEVQWYKHFRGIAE